MIYHRYDPATGLFIESIESSDQPENAISGDLPEQTDKYTVAFIGGQWVSVIRPEPPGSGQPEPSALELAIINRRREYPTPEEFMNAFFDGGQTALDALQAKRLEVKQKYPKPQE